MLNKKELIAIISTTLVLGIIISLLETWTIFFTALGLILAVILINILTKKIISFYLNSELEIKQWEFKKWGFKKHQHLRTPIPAGIFMPILIKFISVGILNWMACLTFEVKGKIYRAARRHGVYSFSEVTEREIAWIAGGAIIANLFFGLLGYILDYTLFARLNLVFAFYSLIPLSDLDGTKIFFGSKLLWAILATITTISVLIATLAI